MIVRLVSIAVLALVTAAANCREPAGPVPTARYDLEHARALWATAGPSSYRYEYRDVCFCAVQHYRVTVIDGAVAEVVRIGDGPTWGGELTGTTVEGLFDRLAQGLAADPYDAEIRFHPELGYPVQAHLDPVEHAVDEEWGFVLEGFRALP